MKSAQILSCLRIGILVIFGLTGCRQVDPAPPIIPELEKPSFSDAVIDKMERYRILAEGLTPVAKTKRGNVFAIEGEFYYQQTDGDEIGSEAFGKAWRNDEGTLVFWGNASAHFGNIVMTPDGSGEIHLFPTGKYKVIGNPKTSDESRTRISIPIKDN